MSGVGVWQTLLGAAFVTPDAIGFGYYSEKALAKLQADLEAGISPNEAASFAGTVCPFRNLRRVYVQESRNRVVIESVDMLLRDREDFNFVTAGACQEFCDVLLENLGPDWERRMFPYRPFWLMVFPVAILLVAAFFLAVSVAIFFTGPTQPGAGPGGTKGGPNPFAGLVCGGLSLAVLTGAGFWLWYLIKHPPRRDMIQRI